MSHTHLAPLLLLSCAAIGRADRIDDLVSAEMTAHHIPGLSIAVVRQGQVVKAAGYGWADEDKRIQATADTVYEIGSMTKQFTAVAVLQLVERGKVGLDDTVAKYVDSSPPAWHDVTIRELLSHTSGIKNDNDAVSIFGRIRRQLTVDQTLDLVRAYPLDFPAGTSFHYSNTNYLLLGKIIERVTGQRYWDYLSANVLSPAGMTNTRAADPKAAIPDLANGYFILRGGSARQGVLTTADAGWAAGSLVSTVGDLAKWDDALYSDKLLGATYKNEMFSPARLSNGAKIQYGFGWFVRNVQGHRVLQHGGNTASFSSQIYRLPDDQITVIVLTNRIAYSGARFARRVAAMFLPALDPPPIVDTNPEITSSLRATLEKVQDGTADDTEFSPEMWAEIKGKRLEGISRELRGFGPLSSIQLIGKSEGASPVYTYDCAFDQTDMQFRCRLDAGAKIAAWWFNLE